MRLFFPEDFAITNSSKQTWKLFAQTFPFGTDFSAKQFSVNTSCNSQSCCQDN